LKKKWFVLAVTLIFMLSLSSTVFAAPKTSHNDKIANKDSMETQQTEEIEEEIEEEIAEEDFLLSAPAIAARILEYNDVKPRYGTGKEGGNFIADVAAHMGPKTLFSEVDNKEDLEAYWDAVLLFLNEHLMIPKTLVMPDYSPVCEAPVLINGGFEAPVVAGGWSTYPTGTLNMGWTVEWMDTYAEAATLELQRSSAVGLEPFEGSQYAELDSYHSTKIYQDINTCPERKYSLSFAYYPRTADSEIEVWWNGAKLGTFDDSNAEWTTQPYSDLSATTTSTRLEFREIGTSDGLGMFLDDVTIGFDEAS